MSENLQTPNDAVIIEIRAGAGGNEASLFARDLYRMYSRYAQKKGWHCKILEENRTEIGGFKEIIFKIKGDGVFSELKQEGGVHRVQRIPETEKGGRIHTSTATVAVLPQPKTADININPADLKIDFYRASGPGGQYVNKRETAVRITHKPTGIVVSSQNERNQLENKRNALAILEARLLAKQKEEQEARLGGNRRSQIKEAMRAEKIRTYNFPQNRITDHRINKKWHNLDTILDGDLKPIVKAFKKQERKK